MLARPLATSPGMRLVGKRLLLAVPIVLGVSILTFWVINLIPGSAAQQLLGPEATPDQIRAMELRLGLNKPAHERYLDWLDVVKVPSKTA